MSRELNTFTKTVLFKPSTLRILREGGARIDNITLGGNKQKEESDGDKINTGSFRFDPAGSPLKSTQQLNVDWSKWENHTFFNSAQVKVQTAFDKIINNFPFDGKKSEHSEFVDSLSGFHKYFLDLFPKNKGCLKFDRTHNNYLSIEDSQGTGVVAGSLGASGDAVLDFSYLPFTIEAQVFIPSGSINDNEVILQRISGSTHGFTLAVSASHSEASTKGTAKIYAYLSSGSVLLSSSITVDKGKFNHVATVYDRNNTGNLRMYLDGALMTTSSNAALFEDYAFQVENTTIGSGTLHSVGDFTFLPAQNLSGALDELRWFHEVRTRKQLKNFKNVNIFPDAKRKLKLYFRFNEPSGSFGDSSRTGNESLVLDYSGYGLHSSIENFDMSLRNTGSLPQALVSEDASLSPVLFPSYDDVTGLATQLLSSASQYDYNNPNLITNLVPKNYLLEASAKEGYETEFGDITESPAYTSDNPGGSRLQSPQIIAALLYTWAETFDELKMFVDEFGRLLKVDYVSAGTISDQLLPFLARYYGMNLPNAYANATMAQMLDKQNITLNNLHATNGLQHIQNILWRRVLSDLPELVKSKGTRHSLEAIFRNLGINPDGVFRIREYGGSKTLTIGDSFERRTEIAAMLDFSGSLRSAGTIGASGKDNNRPLIHSAFMSSSRKEPGVPAIKGSFDVDHISTEERDGLYTSGSWTVEGVFKFNPTTKNHPSNQSLLRIQTTGSTQAGGSNNWLIFNTVATKAVTSSNTTGSLYLYGRPNGGSSASTFSLFLTGVNVFDGNKWHIAFGRTRNDQADSYVSSSYFLRAGRMGVERVEDFHVTSAYYDDSGDNVLNTLSGSTNASGSFLAIGSQSLKYDSDLTGGGFLNSVSDTTANWVDFTGKCAGIKFYSKALTQKETLTHIKNFKSVGVEDPHINFNFNTADSGSFERLRINLTCDQPVTKSNAYGKFEVFDFSKNELHASGSGFIADKRVIKPERYDYLLLSPRFETATAPNKIRIRSFQQLQNLRKADMSTTSLAPLYSIPENDQPKDDRRLSIEVSSVQALNEDIMNIFATLNSLDNAIGNPELVFSQEYRSLRHLRKLYFNRLNEKVSLTKFFEFFKWFDDTVGGLLEEMIPSSTRYLGTNFVVESHALERPKFTYKYNDIYVGIFDRREASVIYMQQFFATVRKI